MDFQFDAHQDYQREAIEAVTELFAGQPRNEFEMSLALGSSIAAVPNKLVLSEERLLENLRSVQERRGLVPSMRLETIAQEIETASGVVASAFPNFSVEMETGTGKTYVYLRTALALYQRYGLRKFIVVVPSLAVREGVLQTVADTKKHFADLYANPPLCCYRYDSQNLAQVRQFALSDSVELMIMTLDAFNKAENVIAQSNEKLLGEKPLHLVQAARPVLILDEPQNMESEKSIAALARLHPLFALRYSATHKNPYNLVYRLTPYDAYRLGLVKRIEVASLVTKDNFNDVFLRLDDLVADKRGQRARLAVHQQQKGGAIKEKVVTVGPGDALEEKANRPEYKGYEIDEINVAGGFVRFNNQVELTKGASQGADREALFDAQIRYTIEEHFKKQQRLRASGIKVLSLFFIDRVASYADDDGVVKRLFDKNFAELRGGFPEWKDKAARDVRSGYFAAKKRASGETLVDSESGSSREDEGAYDLILRNKKRLLSFDEPVSFIFSHSALSEGWDNPNVFQICTLNQRISPLTKRQEIGRGVRLCVDQTGQRIFEERANVLTVVANQAYEKYVETLQSEITAEYGEDGVPPKPPNARERKTIRLDKERMLSPDFQQLWDRIKPRTRYAVKLDTGRLVADVADQIAAMHVAAATIQAGKAAVVVGDDGFTAQTIAASTTIAAISSWAAPDLLGVVEHLLESEHPPVRVSRRTLAGLLASPAAVERATKNPRDFATRLARLLREGLSDQLVEGLRYEPIDEFYDVTRLEDSDLTQSFCEYLVKAERSVFDHVECQSTVERDFVGALEALEKQVLVYVKLPRWFLVPTPVGDYNPDWAIVWQEHDAHGEPLSEKRLYLVRETKSTLQRGKWRPDERRKVACGEKHFRGALGADFAVVTSASELPAGGSPAGD